MPSSSVTQDRAARKATALRTQWRALGAFGRVSVFGVVLSAVIAIVLGFVIPAAVEDNLIDTRVDSFTAVAEDLQDRGLIPSAVPDAQEVAALGDAIALRLLGGDTVRVKLWSRDSTVLYSDAEALIGQTFPPSTERQKAFAGHTCVRAPDLERPENKGDQDLGPLREFYIPVVGDDGSIAAVFEVYQDAAPLDATVADTRRIVWFSIGIGLGILLIFMTALTVSTARVVTGRARQAERQFTALVHAREEERHRIVGALHDDIGQPLYRVLMGIQGGRSQVDPDSPVAGELSRLEGLVRTLDDTLRTELRLLHHGPVEQLGLDELLEELTERTNAETGLHVELELEPHQRLAIPVKAALFRAANEAVTNARKHSGASSVWITVRNGAGRLILDVEDDGTGIAQPHGLGLTTTRERLEATRGGLTVTQRPGTGTLFRAWVDTNGNSEPR